MTPEDRLQCFDWARHISIGMSVEENANTLVDWAGEEPLRMAALAFVFKREGHKHLVRVIDLASEYATYAGLPPTSVEVKAPPKADKPKFISKKQSSKKKARST